MLIKIIKMSKRHSYHTQIWHLKGLVWKNVISLPIFRTILYFTNLSLFVGKVWTPCSWKKNLKTLLPCSHFSFSLYRFGLNYVDDKYFYMFEGSFSSMINGLLINFAIIAWENLLVARNGSRLRSVQIP